MKTNKNNLVMLAVKNKQVAYGVSGGYLILDNIALPVKLNPYSTVHEAFDGIKYYQEYIKYAEGNAKDRETYFTILIHAVSTYGDNKDTSKLRENVINYDFNTFKEFMQL